MTTDRERDAENLRHYEAQLKRADARVREAEAERATLVPIVEALRVRVGGTHSIGTGSVGISTTIEPALDLDIVPNLDRVTPARPTYRGRPTIPVLILEVMSDGQTRTVDQIYSALCAHGALKDDQPSRRSMINRLGDLVQDGQLEKLRRGVFRLAREAGAENGDSSGYPSQAGDQKTLGDHHVDSDRPGHPSSADG